MSRDDRESPDTPADGFAELVEIIRRLRAPGGCPWDREQTPESLKPYVIEEAYEVVDAIDGGRADELCEELGDLLLQIVLQAQIAAERGRFDIGDVVRGLSAKMVGRHPHVFGDAKVDGAGDVLVNWERIKKREKADRGLFDGLPSHLPGLLKAARMGEKAGRVGFDWPDAAAVREKVAEELGELDEAAAGGEAAAVRHELGDLLFAVAQWGRHLGEAPEEAMRAACRRFAGRFEAMARDLGERGRDLEALDADELEAAWRRAKREGGA